MIKARSHGGYAWDDLHGFVMSGGQDEDLAPLSHVETTSDGVNFGHFTPLPQSVMNQCLVSLNNGGDLFVTGGDDGEVNQSGFEIFIKSLANDRVLGCVISHTVGGGIHAI